MSVPEDRGGEGESRKQSPGLCPQELRVSSKKGETPLCLAGVGITIAVWPWKTAVKLGGHCHMLSHTQFLFVQFSPIGGQHTLTNLRSMGPLW